MRKPNRARKNELSKLRGERRVQMGTATRHSLTCQVTKGGVRWAAWCSCGWMTPRWKGDTPRTFATEREAVRACVGHHRWASPDGLGTVRRDRINGL
jgi:hypothetical protein